MENSEHAMAPTLASRSAALRSSLTGRMIAAVATPMDVNGRVSETVLTEYAQKLATQVDSVCVWAHTGRGLHLTPEARRLSMTAFRAAQVGPVIAAVGPTNATDDFDSQLRSTIELAEEAAGLGADGLMVYPMSSLRPEDTRQERAVRLHREVAESAGLPVIGFYLYQRAGGIEYSPSLLAELCELPAMVGVKLALLNDAIVCQDAIAAIRGAGGLAITGEDRMLGPSLTWGAESVLVGLGAAATEVTTRVVKAWFSGNAADFIAASRRLDDFAGAIFREPMDAYVQRMLWLAAAEGLIPDDFAHDFHGPKIAPGERREVRKAFERATEKTVSLHAESIHDGGAPGRASVDLADSFREP